MNFDDLVERKLVVKKEYGNGLSVYKYNRNVFYNNLWNADPRLLEARGVVLDAEGNKIIYPFTKVFNYKENGTTLSLDTKVIAPMKVNGFMAAVAWYNDELLVSTTGTLDSDFATLARNVIEWQIDKNVIQLNHTYIFEICDPSDPHIIEEQSGAYLIGIRNMETGGMFTEEMLDHEACVIGAHRPYVFVCTFGDVIELSKRCQHEGFMVRLDNEEQTTVMKLKSPYYLTKKFLMRMGAGKTELMVTNPTKFKESIDEEYYPLVDFISVNYRQTWFGMTDQERRKVIEDFFNS